MFRNKKFVVNEDGKKTAVIIPYRAYLALMEDLSDLTVVNARKRERTINTKDLERRLKQNEFL